MMEASNSSTFKVGDWVIRTDLFGTSVSRTRWLAWGGSEIAICVDSIPFDNHLKFDGIKNTTLKNGWNPKNFRHATSVERLRGASAVARDQAIERYYGAMDDTTFQAQRSHPAEYRAATAPAEPPPLFFGRVPDPEWPCGRWLARDYKHAKVMEPDYPHWDENPTRYSSAYSFPLLAPPLSLWVDGVMATGPCTVEKGQTWAVRTTEPVTGALTRREQAEADYADWTNKMDQRNDTMDAERDRMRDRLEALEAKPPEPFEEWAAAMIAAKAIDSQSKAKTLVDEENTQDDAGSDDPIHKEIDMSDKTTQEPLQIGPAEGIEGAEPNLLDNSLAMDVPEEIREAAKRAGIGFEDLTDVVLKCKAIEREERRTDKQNAHAERREVSIGRYNRDEEVDDFNLKHKKVENDHHFRSQRLSNQHVRALEEILNNDRINERATQVKLARIKSKVDIKNTHGVNVGTCRWEAIKTASDRLASAVRWTAIACAGTAIAYVISQIFV